MSFGSSALELLGTPSPRIPSCRRGGETLVLVISTGQKSIRGLASLHPSIGKGTPSTSSPSINYLLHLLLQRERVFKTEEKKGKHFFILFYKDHNLGINTTSVLHNRERVSTATTGIPSTHLRQTKVTDISDHNQCAINIYIYMYISI